MKQKLEDGKIILEINIYELLHDVATSDDREKLIESLSCHEDIIKNVSEILVEGYTDRGFSGLWSPSMDSAAQKARKLIAEKHDYAGRQTIRDLELKVSLLEKDVRYWQDKARERCASY